MDTIWDRKSEVIGRCGGDEKKRMTTQNQQKSNAKKQKRKHLFSYVYQHIQTDNILVANKNVTQYVMTSLVYRNIISECNI